MICFRQLGLLYSIVFHSVLSDLSICIHLNALKVLFDTLFQRLVPVLAIPFLQQSRTQLVGHLAEILRLIWIDLHLRPVQIRAHFLDRLDASVGIEGKREPEDALVLEGLVQHRGTEVQPRVVNNIDEVLCDYR